MLSVKTLQDMLDKLPEDTVVYVEADHGQLPEQSSGIYFYESGSQQFVSPYYGDDLDWKDLFETEDDYDFSHVKAVLILA